tara:strand:+ start:828 stop:1064 length:237 start_codon:yes stop_codon:yes gene_type:complete
VAPWAIEVLVIQDVGTLHEEKSPAASVCAVGEELQGIRRPGLDDEERRLPRNPDMKGLLQLHMRERREEVGRSIAHDP